jgi:ferredoxin
MLVIDRHQCFQCAGCLAVCPTAALSLTLTGLEVDPALCDMCGVCVRFCPVLALTADRREPTAAGKESS